MIYILALVSLVLLVILHSALPRRRVFWCFCLLLLTAGATVYISDRNHGQQRMMTESELSALWAAQQNFAVWYGEYQKDIVEMDHNWQSYHDCLSDFQNDDIDAQTLYERLLPLEEETRQKTEEIARLTPPAGMSSECDALLRTIITKTHTYAAAQHKTIALTCSAAQAAKIADTDIIDEAVVAKRRINDVPLRHAPAGLFVAKEITAIRVLLTAPE